MINRFSLIEANSPENKTVPFHFILNLALILHMNTEHVKQNNNNNNK